MAVLSITSLPDVLFDLRIAEGTLLLALLCSAPLLRGKPPQPASTNGHSESAEVIRIVEVPRRQAITLLLSILALTAFLDGSVTVATVVFNQYPEITLDPWRGAGFYPVSLLVAFAGLAVVSEIKEARGVPIWQSKLLKLFVLIALTFDVALAVLIPLTVPIWKIRENLNPHVPETPSPVLPVGPAPAVHFGLAVLRTLVLLVLFPILFSTRKTYEPVGHSGSTQQNGETSLLIPATTTATAGTSASVSVPKAAYGTFDPASSTSPQIKTATPIPAVGTSTTDKSANDELSWMEVGSRLRRLSPYLWPSKNVDLQLLAVVCFAILGAGRAVSAAIPFKLSDAIGALSQNDARIVVPAILWYVGLKALQGSGGLATLRNFLWTPVMQYTNRSMSQLAFDHLLNLSLAWHTRRKTGEVLRILDRGTAINQIVELIIFNVLATLADLAIALYIFFWYFGPVMSVLVATIMVTYVVVSTLLTSWWTKLRRSMNEADIAPRGIHTDCLLNYETVKYFGGEAHEGERYRQAISRYQRMEIKTIAGLNLMSLIQNLLLSTGLLIGSFMVVFDATYPHDQVVKRFVVFITYLAQLYGPLNSLAYIYRGINQSLVDTERLMDLLEEQPEVQDKPDAKDIIVTDGVIEFDNVTFSYDNRTTALNGVSFTIPKGGSMALVGESGSGKSTILRLLYRFYDLAPGNGAIRIDGQDIRDVTQASLRKAIGVVPQDSVLFNNTIAYNIGYGKFGALGDEIESAARAAQMHERIMSFPDGYETAVGERGIRLSGGEKQRVAIARTILKAPQVILLDEATSALDTTTEREIQKALQNLVHGRSSLSIAHRLSTILNSDLILVLHQGEIIESGSYRELVERDGRFAAMWAEQISSGDNTHAPSDTPRNEIPVGSTSQAHIVPIPVNVSDGPGFVAAESVAASPGSPAPGSQIAPAEQLVPVTVRSEITVPNESEQQVADGASLAEVRPDVFVASGSVVSMAHDSSKAAEESSTVNPETASPTSRQLEPTPATNPLPLPKSNDAPSSVVSNRPDLREAIPSNSGTPSITVSPSPEPESDRLKQAAQRFRMASQGAAARSGQSIARLARRVSPRSNRQADNGSHLDVTSTRKAGFLRWGSSTSVGQLSREDTEGQVVDSDKKKSKKDKRKGGD